MQKKILIFFLTYLYFPSASADDKVNQAIDFLKIACSSGEKVAIKAEGDGGLSLKRKNIQGKIYLDKTEVRGIAEGLTSENQTQNLQSVRECMKPHVDRILDIILGDSPPILGSSTNFITDPESKCQVFNSYPQPNETIKYNGSCKNGLAEGYGVLQWYQNGVAKQKFEGEFKDGKANGQGVYLWPDGIRYEGKFKDDEFTGQGVKTWPDGTRYEGELKDGKFNGQGIYLWADGTRYEGEFKDDKLNGQGIKTEPDGTRYEGEFKDDKLNGQGIKTWPKGYRCKGEFKDERLKGIITCSDNIPIGVLLSPDS